MPRGTTEITLLNNARPKNLILSRGRGGSPAVEWGNQQNGKGGPILSPVGPDNSNNTTPWLIRKRRRRRR
ncbi:hypothetical protein GE061_015725 [Apolygus lucorum]|uniref:Uncharacterized protein n=1 Tax=Apolygus lucorum TaxID=248454 RepID=A0A8S9XLS6_APOLU|nr:hypothetical protein GE061_015725 [Apolygus lucorum]